MKLATDPLAPTAASVSCCCAAAAAARSRPQPAATKRQGRSDRYPIATSSIEGGTAWIGTDRPVVAGDGEAPLRGTALKPYRMSCATITNVEFQAFVDASGYVTDAEREGASYVFHTQLAEGATDLGGVYGTPWWRRVRGACWSNVGGGSVETRDRRDHPVVHVSWHDACAFAEWAGGRLPTEAEWEHAARGGMGDVRYPWGDDDPPEGGGALCNIWSGPFPQAAEPARAVVGTIPARFGAANGFGLYNLCGNVWEWTADRFANQFGEDPRRRVLKGGSFLCHDSYCFRYRIPARIGASPNSTTSHQGFRILFDRNAD